MKSNYDSYWFKDGEVSGTTVYEQEEVYLTKLLGPDGQPYAIHRPRRQIGFDLLHRKSNSS